MLWKTVSAIMLTLLLTSMLTLAFNIQPAKAASETIIDTHGDSRFTKYPVGGPYWWPRSDYGAYNNNFWYTYCGVPGEDPLYWGSWYVLISGEYEVFVWIPDPDTFGGYTPTHSAKYTVYHQGGYTEKTVNQALRLGGWYSLGTFTFGTDAWITLTDRTGEPYLSTMVAFDAIKFVTTSPINQPFTLNNGYVSPSSGDTSTTFSYYVTYSDPEGDVPTLKYVYIDGSPHTMAKISGDYVSGAVFRYSTTLSAGSHNYYFYFKDRVVDGYTVRLPISDTYPGPNVTPPPQPPYKPTVVSQYRSDGVTVIPEGGTTPESTVVFKATVSDPDGDSVRLEIELRQMGEPFTGEPTAVSDFVPSGSQVSITRYGLVNADYHWRYRAKDIRGATSDWTEFGAVGNMDFRVSVPTLPTAGKPVLISPLEILPEPPYFVGDTLTAKFTIRNDGDAAITLDKLLVGGRFNDGTLPNGEFPDFTFQTVTLQQGQTHPYEGTLELTEAGNYHFFIAYYIENPSEEEKKLLDENNWNTCISLAEGLTDQDRTKEILATVNGKSTKFSAGDCVIIQKYNRLYQEPGLDSDSSYIYENKCGRIIENENNGIFADGHFWWHIELQPIPFEYWVLEEAIIKNQPPIPSLNYAPQHPKANEEVVFDALGSQDADGKIERYTWYLNGEFIGWNENPIMFYAFEKEGHFNLKVEVTDDCLESESIEVTIEVEGKTRPEKIRKILDKDDIIKIADELGIPHYTQDCGLWCQIEYFVLEGENYSEDELLAVLNKPIKKISETGSLTFVEDVIYGMRIRNILEDAKLVDLTSSGTWNPEPDDFKNLKKANTWVETIVNWEEPFLSRYLEVVAYTLDMPLSAVCHVVGGLIGPILTIAEGYKVYKTLDFLENLLYKRALWFYLQQRIGGDDSVNAFGSSPVPIEYRSETTRESWEELYQTYEPYIILGEGGLGENFEEIKAELRRHIYDTMESYSLMPRKFVRIGSVGELRVYDSEGRVTGIVNGEIREEISYSMYDEDTETIIIFPAIGSYHYEILGIDEGTYSLKIASVEYGNTIAFTATDISTTANAVHQYIVNWDALSLGEEGVTVLVDADGDDIFEHTFTSDSELTQSEFLAQTPYTFSIVWGEETFIVSVESNSTVSNFAFSQPNKEISFNVTGEVGTVGFCNVTIPKALLYGEPWTVLIDGASVLPTITENATHSFLYFTYTHSTHRIQIIGTWVIGPPPPTYSLTITTSVGGTTDPAPGTYSYTANSTVEVTAIPEANYLFDYWELDSVNVGSANPYAVLMDKNHTLKAVFSPVAPPLSASISPLSASTLVGQSVTFTSTVSGGVTPYSYQWYLNDAPVSGATSDIWTFTPTTSGIYYVYLKVTDDMDNTAQSETARITVAAVPVGGYSVLIQLPTIAKPATIHIALLTILTAIFITIKRKAKRKH